MSEHKLIKNLTDDNFQTEIEGKVVLVDFNAVWCAPCRMLSPIVEQVAEHYAEKALVAKVDIDNEQKTAAKFQVTSVPTLILFKNGEVVDRLVGLRDFESIKKFVDSAFE